MAMPARRDGSACRGYWLKAGPAASPTFLSLVEHSYASLLVSGSRRKVFVPRERGQPSPSPTSPCCLCAPPDFMPTRTHASRQCLPIQVPVCPHNTFVHLAWQIGAHEKMGKKTLRPGWQIGSVFSFIFFCEGAAHSYLITAALKCALWESFGFQTLCSNSLNFVSMFGAVGHLKFLLGFYP